MINILYIYFYKEFMLLRTLKSSGLSLILLIFIWLLNLFSKLFESQILSLLLSSLIWKGKGALSYRELGGGHESSERFYLSGSVSNGSLPELT